MICSQNSSSKTEHPTKKHATANQIKHFYLFLVASHAFIETAHSKPERSASSNSGVIHLFNPQLSSEYFEEAQRKEITALLSDSPSLQSKLVECISKAYKDANWYAHIETGLPEEDFPPDCLWSFNQVNRQNCFQCRVAFFTGYHWEGEYPKPETSMMPCQCIMMHYYHIHDVSN
ncbi:DUF29 family protein [Endozoicomonas acroporae]|uniref:DUF29 family protein n=1 Tax=Endozoicomonas acroporae TaxID=1701104 RepID=UPI000C77AE1B